MQGDSWADLARYHSGEDLIEELYRAMEELATPGSYEHRPMDMRPLRFIGEPIQVQFDEKPALEKKPGCPDRFVWGEDTYQIAERLSEWHDYTRRGRMARNMRPTHAAVAARRGSWGVGRDYFRVRTDTGQVFDLYYDRAPKRADDRKGEWFLYREMTESKVEG